ncbi:MAG: zf-HC2 domain-containing protein [Candidatus Bipolaricaulota bacterium]|nr:zf-HC2 domain-containing protein [Candidatus Bipolaricaulota bacterium]
MTDCDKILEMMPWYVTGKLDAKDTAALAAHIQTCDACRQELAEVVWVRHAVSSEKRDLPTVRQRVWRKVMSRAGFRDMAHVDIGSMLVGFRLGVNARRPNSPVRASLHVMGRNVRIVGKERREGCETPDEKK